MQTRFVTDGGTDARRVIIPMVPRRGDGGQKGYIPPAESALDAPKASAGGIRRPKKAEEAHGQKTRTCNCAHRFTIFPYSDIRFILAVEQDQY